MEDTRYCKNCEEYVTPLPYGACPGCDEKSGLRASPEPDEEPEPAIPGKNEPGDEALGSVDIGSVDSGSVKDRHGLLTGFLVLMVAAHGVVSALVLVQLLQRADDVWLNLSENPLQALLGILVAVATLARLACSIALLRWRMWGFWGHVVASIFIAFVMTCGQVNLRNALGWLLSVAILYGMLHVGGARKAWPRLSDDSPVERLFRRTPALLPCLLLALSGGLVAATPWLITAFPGGAGHDADVAGTAYIYSTVSGLIGAWLLALVYRSRRAEMRP